MPLNTIKYYPLLLNTISIPFAPNKLQPKPSCLPPAHPAPLLSSQDCLGFLEHLRGGDPEDGADRQGLRDKKTQVTLLPTI